MSRLGSQKRWIRESSIIGITEVRVLVGNDDILRDRQRHAGVVRPTVAQSVWCDQTADSILTGGRLVRVGPTRTYRRNSSTAAQDACAASAL